MPSLVGVLGPSLAVNARAVLYHAPLATANKLRR